jgi:deoxycytidylate deaminase
VDVLINHPHKHELTSCHAAVLVSGPRIIAIGINQPWRPQLVRDIKRAHENLSTHAELSCIMQARKNDMEGCKMYVARVLKDGYTVAMSRPCNFCQEALFGHKIKRAIYTTYSGNIGSMKIKGPFLKAAAFSE